MRNALKLATAAAALTLVLAFAENAFATQRVTVSQTATSLKIKILQDASDAQPAKVLIHVPVGVLTKALPGEKIGAAAAHVIAHDAADARVALQGDLRVGDPAKFLPNPCFSGEDEEADIWLVEFPLAATRPQLAAFVS